MKNSCSLVPDALLDSEDYRQPKLDIAGAFSLSSSDAVNGGGISRPTG